MQDMPMPPAAKAEAPAAGGAKDLIVRINDDLMSLMDLMSGSKAVTPDDQKELAAVISGFKNVVEGLAQAPGAPKAAPTMPGVATPEVGANPNVRPAL